jgi:hypothetical protein
MWNRFWGSLYLRQLSFFLLLSLFHFTLRVGYTPRLLRIFLVFFDDSLFAIFAFCLVLLGLFPSTTPEISYLVCPLCFLICDPDDMKSVGGLSSHLMFDGVIYWCLFLTILLPTLWFFLSHKDHEKMAWHCFAFFDVYLRRLDVDERHSSVRLFLLSIISFFCNSSPIAERRNPAVRRGFSM